MDLLTLAMNCAFLLACLTLTSVFCPSAGGWGGEHERITEAAILLLPAERQEYIKPERMALTRTYCGFPDLNWPCYGQWGGGVGDPKAPRFPDFRREWEVSYYCQWDPVLRKGRGFPHKPPESYEAVGIFFLKAAEALRAGRLEDGMRFTGVMFHYIQDSGAFGHMQPIHRSFHVKDQDRIRLEGYVLQPLGARPEDAAKMLSDRLREMVEWTENRVAPLIEEMGLSWEQAKSLCTQETMPPAVEKAVEEVRRKKAAEFEAATLDCAHACVRLCADALHSVLASATKPCSAPGNVDTPNLLFNFSFEEDDGDGIPDGWYVAWLDLDDRVGRAERYGTATHWEKFVKSGQFSALLLWTPKKGIEWRQTWRRAVKVEPERTYSASTWLKTRKATGRNFLALEFYDTDYQPLAQAQSESYQGDTEWRQVTVTASAPANARWARVILHSDSNEGAVWWDDVALQGRPSPAEKSNETKVRP